MHYFGYMSQTVVFQLIWWISALCHNILEFRGKKGSVASPMLNKTVKSIKALSHCPVLRARYYYVSAPYVVPNFRGVLGFTRFLVGFNYVLLGFNTYIAVLKA
jgi:hypothetical protein